MKTETIQNLRRAEDYDNREDWLQAWDKARKKVINHLRKIRREHKLDKNLGWVVETFVLRNFNDFDSMLCISGGEGVGKSTLAYWIARMMDLLFTIEKTFIFSPKTQEAIKQAKELHPFGAIVLDEGVKAAYKLNWNKSIQIQLKKVFNINRSENKTTIVCIPNYRDLDSYFRNHRVKFWIHVYSRSKAVVFRRQDNPYATDPFLLDWNDRDWLKSVLKKGRKAKILDDEELLKKMQRNPCYFEEFVFPSIPWSHFQQYSRLKEHFKYEDEDEANKPSNIQLQRDQAIAALYKKGMPVTEIMRLFGTKRTTTYDALNRSGIRHPSNNNSISKRENLKNSQKGGGFNKTAQL